MARWQRPVPPNDQVISPTGDTAFVGMDLKTRDPAQLLTGWYHEAYNARVENGGLGSRKGCLAPGTFNYISYGQIYGVGIYSDPNGQEYLAIATSAGVWFTYDGGNGTLVPMATKINYPVEFSQAFQNFYMWRGPSMTPLVWQGDWAVYWQELTDPSVISTEYKGNWNWDSSLGNPGAGQVATGTRDWTSTNTIVQVAKTTSDAIDASSELLTLPAVNDLIKMVDTADPTFWVQWHINAVGTDQGAFVQYAVSWNSGSLTTPANNTPVTVTFLAASKADTSRKPMPNAYTAETFGNRLLVPHGRDGLAISDVQESVYQWAQNDFRINAGEADTLVRVFPWVQTTVLCFKQHSIFQMANVTGDLSGTTLQKLPGSLGLCGLKAVVAVSGDVFFMDWSGVYKIMQIFEGSPQASSLPVSDNIKPIIDTINWTCAAGIRAESRRERVYFAVPLLNAVRNNALLVYNMVTTAWESIDTFGDPDFRIDDLVKTNYIGERRLFAIDRQKSLILLLEQGKTDLMGSDGTTEQQIQFAVLTRGYAGVGPRNSFPRVGIDVATWNPDFSVEAFVDGSNAKTLVSNRLKDRTKYDSFGKPHWNLENLNDDHATARRKDYSVFLPLRIGYNGVQIERHQESTERFDVDLYGRYCQFRISNTQGTIGIRSVFLETFEDQRAERTQI